MHRATELPSSATTQIHTPSEHEERLAQLPWDFPLEEWPEHGVVPLSVRKGESRHPVIFVELEGVRYAIKETSPHMAEREIRNLREIERRGIPTLHPIGDVRIKAPPLLLDAAGPGGVREYISGDRGYTITSLAPRVVPHSLLFRIPFTKKNKRHIWAAVAVLLVELHEHGIFWGDPSLANILVRIDGRRILAIMADAETAELFPGPISEALRQQDLDLFKEALLWQAEDLRIARGLPEQKDLVDEADFRYFKRRYQWLRKEHARLIEGPTFTSQFQAQRVIEALNHWGYSLLSMGGAAFEGFATVLPGWHQRRIEKLLDIQVPGNYARRFYNMLLGHQAIMSQQRRREVTIEEAAQHWYTYYHLPTILLLRQNLTQGQDPLKAYFAIMLYKWKLSKELGYEVPIDEAVLDWAVQQAKTDKLGAIDPAALASQWREQATTTNILEPPLIESEQLQPLLSPAEQPLVQLPPPEREQQLVHVLEQHEQEIKANEAEE